MNFCKRHRGQANPENGRVSDGCPFLNLLHEGLLVPCFSVAFPCFPPGSVEDMKPIDWEGVSSLNVL